MSIELAMLFNHFILCCRFLCLPSIFPSIRIFSSTSGLHIRWPKYWSFSFSISPYNEYSGLISFRIDWLIDLLEVQGTLKSLLQHHNSKALVLRHSAFFMVQLSHPYMTTGKTIALTRRTIGGKVMSLLFNILSRFVITFLPSPFITRLWAMKGDSVINLVYDVLLSVEGTEDLRRQVKWIEEAGFPPNTTYTLYFSVFSISFQYIPNHLI